MTWEEQRGKDQKMDFLKLHRNVETLQIYAVKLHLNPPVG